MSPLSILLDAVILSAAAFGCIVLTGTLAGLVAFGLLDRFFRAATQREALFHYIDLYSNDIVERFRLFYLNKYGSSMPYLYPEEYDLRYPAKFIERSTGLGSEIFYGLHYRQICGQLQAIVSAEDSSRRESEQEYTPLTDFLTVLARSRLAPFDREERAGGRRNYTQEALLEIDRIQAALGDALARRSFAAVGISIFFIYAVVLGWVTFSALQVRFFDFFAGLAAVALYIAAFVLVIVAAALIALGSAAVAMLVLGWLDRALTSR